MFWGTKPKALLVGVAAAVAAVSPVLTPTAHAAARGMLLTLGEGGVGNGVHFPNGAINRDHVHLLLSIPPQLSVSRAVKYLKGKS